MTDIVPAEEQFYSTKRVAQIFDVTNETVIDWIKRGLLEATIVNRRYRVSRASVLRLANSRYGQE